MIRKERGSRLNYCKVFSYASCVLFVLWVLPLILKKYADTSFPYIKEEDIVLELVGSIGSSPNGLKWCPLWSPYTRGASVNIYEELDQGNYENETIVHLHNIQPGGTWQPMMCSARYEVVIIVPYRNRLEHLRKFLAYMHPFLQRQLLKYRIIIVEQNDELPFNRAKLFNIGYKESQKLSLSNSCLIFHDVDLIPLNDRNMYACTHQPRHMYSAIDSFRYHLPYRNLFGGAIAILSQHFEEVNGFSNLFGGWGGEDDEFAIRLKSKGLSFVRFDPSLASYVMLSHVKELPAPGRWENLRKSENSAKRDGLSSLIYKVDRKDFLPLYTHILVS